MLKKYISYLGIFIFTCFSFFYTDRAVDIVKRNDPIMKKILQTKENYLIESVNATIKDDEIVPGINGLMVNTDKSYQEMKKNNSYNESMLVFEEIKPDISFINEYDKYITSGNKEKNNISLVFKIDDLTYINFLNEILIQKNIVATFFIDGSILETNLDKVIELNNNNFEIENLGYDSKYIEDKLLWTNNLLSSITKNDPKFCYTDYKVEEVLELCSKYNMYTIKPTILVNSYPFQTIKQNLSNGNIISINLNNDTIKELPSIISYIKQKGYNIVLLKDLINEKRVVE